ncbi:HNH endonuclease [Sporosarcina sp. P13]|uniref:HNH endonuclease n=1 Tax=Sporosarcina sp. P13 TaxID=2048263 RepID=UPI000C16E382|nr:HNH endonuclease signature motif containing protein [Sporosarcina sp. P13]PIC65354.1 HNH endonuclease [Sporosarcina sp. P13]
MTKTFPSLTQGEIIKNDQIMKTFGCSGQGGMRRSLDTNTLVIVSNNVKSLYTNRWDGNTLHYTGMGAIGDQTLGTQNKTLAESHTNGVRVYLFEVFKEREYTFRGEVTLVDKPYKGRQNDNDGNEREVWIFPIKVIDHEWSPSEDLIKNSMKKKEEKARSFSEAELLGLAGQAHSNPSKRAVMDKNVYVRDPYVKELSFKLAAGICQLCDSNAPFHDGKGKPFLESHHIDWLSLGGADVIENVIALCPNCHRKMHIVDNEKDVHKLKSRSKDLLDGLQRRLSPKKNR